MDNKITRLYCDGGRWINIGTTVYLIPIKGAKMELLREYKTVLRKESDVYLNTVCINENEAVKDIKDQMNMLQWICFKLFN